MWVLYINRVTSSLVIFSIINVTPIWVMVYFSIWLLRFGLFWGWIFHIFNCHRDIVFYCLIRISNPFQFCILNKFTDNFAILGHLQECLGLKFGSKSWSKIDSKILLISLSFSNPFQKCGRRCILLAPRNKTFLIKICLSCLNMWTLVKVIISMPTVTVSLGRLNLKESLATMLNTHHVACHFLQLNFWFL